MDYMNCICTVYHDMISLFEELLQKDNSVSIHHRNIQVLTTEFFRVCKGISLKIMTMVFPLSQPLNYDLRHQPDSQQDQLKEFTMVQNHKVSSVK